MTQEEWYEKLESGELHLLNEDTVMDEILADWHEERDALQDKLLATQSVLSRAETMLLLYVQYFNGFINTANMLRNALDWNNEGIPEDIIREAHENLEEKYKGALDRVIQQMQEDERKLK